MKAKLILFKFKRKLSKLNEIGIAQKLYQLEEELDMVSDIIDTNKATFPKSPVIKQMIKDDLIHLKGKRRLLNLKIDFIKQNYDH